MIAVDMKTYRASTKQASLNRSVIQSNVSKRAIGCCVRYCTLLLTLSCIHVGSWFDII